MSPDDPDDPTVHIAPDEPDADDDTAPDPQVAHAASLLREAEPADPAEAAWLQDAASRLSHRFREALHGGHASTEIPQPERKSRH